MHYWSICKFIRLNTQKLLSKCTVLSQLSRAHYTMQILSQVLAKCTVWISFLSIYFLVGESGPSVGPYFKSFVNHHLPWRQAYHLTYLKLASLSGNHFCSKKFQRAWWIPFKLRITNEPALYRRICDQNKKKKSKNTIWTVRFVKVSKWASQFDTLTKRTVQMVFFIFLCMRLYSS